MLWYIYIMPCCIRIRCNGGLVGLLGCAVQASSVHDHHECLTGLSYPLHTENTPTGLPQYRPGINGDILESQASLFLTLIISCHATFAHNVLEGWAYTQTSYYLHQWLTMKRPASHGHHDLSYPQHTENIPTVLSQYSPGINGDILEIRALEAFNLAQVPS
ncbi:hypothetical protein BC629DRAFT_318618 [Irpex lacteus]|nr:hypothetical protein BC629DRAFT_318618 [Irpex lacteus]